MDKFIKIKYIFFIICILLVGCSQNRTTTNEQDKSKQANITEQTSIEEKAIEEKTIEENVIEENVILENTTKITNSSDTTIQDDSKIQEQELIEDINSMETKIVIYKSKRQLELWQNGEKTKEYSIGLGKKPEGKKEQEGDKMTPEGEYYVCTKNQYSKFYLSLGVSYPNIEDARNGLDKGMIDEETYNTIETAILNGQCPPWNTALGGEIMIHGHGGSKDWTKGCIAVDDEVMDVLWEVCEMGTQITINP